MKENKFRAWDKKNKKWIGDSFLEYLCVGDNVVLLVNYAPDNNGGYSPKSCKQLTNTEVDNLEIVQYTDLQDKNKTDLYGDDIVNFIVPVGNLVRIPHLSDRYLIKYKNACYGFVPVFPELVHPDDREWQPFYRHEDGEMWDLDYFERIGTIYENPELLEEK